MSEASTASVGASTAPSNSASSTVISNNTCAAAAASVAVASIVREASRRGMRHRLHSNGTRNRRPTQNRATSSTISLTDSIRPLSSTTCGSSRRRPGGPATMPTARPKRTGFADHRVSGRSALVLSCLRTGARYEIGANRLLTAQSSDLIVVGHHVLELAEQDRAHQVRQRIVQCVPVYLQRTALAALALVE